MKEFKILANIEATIGDVEFSIKGKYITIARAMSDEQIDRALAGLAHMVGLIHHGLNKTIIEMV